MVSKNSVSENQINIQLSKALEVDIKEKTVKSFVKDIE